MSGEPSFSEPSVAKNANGIPQGQIQKRIVDGGGVALSVEPAMGTLVLIEQGSTSTSPASSIARDSIGLRRSKESMRSSTIVGIAICIALSILVVRTWSEKTNKEIAREPVKRDAAKVDEKPVEMHPIQVDATVTNGVRGERVNKKRMKKVVAKRRELPSKSGLEPAVGATKNPLSKPVAPRVRKPPENHAVELPDIGNPVDVVPVS